MVIKFPGTKLAELSLMLGEGGARERVTLLLAWAEKRGDKAGQGAGRTPSPEQTPANGDCYNTGCWGRGG